MKTFFNFSKKGFTEIVSVILLLLVGVVAFSGISNWAGNFQTKIMFNADSHTDLNDDLKLMSLSYFDDNISVIVIKNPSQRYIVLDEILLDGVSCNIIYSNVVINFQNIHIYCPVVVGNVYTLEVISNIGFNSQTLLVNK